MVAPLSQSSTGPTDPAQRPVVPQSVGTSPAGTEVADLLRNREGLLTPNRHGCLSLPGPGALRLFGMAESACDIPLKTRLQWLVELERICPALANRTTLIKRRLKRCSD